MEQLLADWATARGLYRNVYARDSSKEEAHSDRAERAQVCRCLYKERALPSVMIITRPTLALFAHGLQLFESGNTASFYLCKYFVDDQLISP
jgi:hypothetical protein